MTSEIERYIRIESLSRSGNRAAVWRTLPNANRVAVWELNNAEAVDDELPEGSDPRRFIFHIGYIDGVVRGCRVTYMGSHFSVLAVSDSTRLRGLELRCAPRTD